MTPTRTGNGGVKARKKTPAQIDREIAQVLAKPYFKIGDVVLMGK